MKHREFWIKNNYPGSLCFNSEITITSPNDWASDIDTWQDFIDRKLSGDAIHVIEYQAYTDAIKQCEMMAEALRHEDCNCSSSTGDMLTKGPDQICRRCEALAKYTKWKDGLR